jgi:hypothetical protein
VPAVIAVRREGWKIKIFLDIDDGIDTETGNAFFKPPVDHLIDFFADDRVLPV